MRAFAAVMFAVCGAIPAALAEVPAQSQIPPQTITQSQNPQWEAIFNSETTFYSWRSSRGYPPTVNLPPLPRGPGHGTLVYSPFGLQLNGRPSDDLKLEFLVRSAYVNSHTVLPDRVADFSALADTTFGTTATWLGWNGIQPFFSINVNTPTGKTNLTGNKSLAQPDSDVSPIAAFGEGLNIGPTIGVNIPFSRNLMAGLGVGYTYRGPFERGGFSLIQQQVDGIRELDPGDVITVNGTLAYRGERLSLSGSISYSWETMTTLDGTPFYKAGNRIMLAAGVGYAWDANWASRVIASYSHMDRNTVPFPPPPTTMLEAFNSNSDMWKVTIDTTYTMGAFSIGPVSTLIYRDKNAWSPTAFHFLPAKLSGSIGGIMQYALSQQATLRARVEHIWIVENEKPDVLPLIGSGIPEIHTRGWIISIAGIFRY